MNSRERMLEKMELYEVDEIDNFSTSIAMSPRRHLRRFILLVLRYQANTISRRIKDA